MPFPDPLLPIALIAMLAAMIVPACFKLLNSGSSEEAFESPSEGLKEENSEYKKVEPFGDNAEPGPLERGEERLRIETKFVEVGSGTEELSFDWIVSPAPIADSTLSPKTRPAEQVGGAKR